jgi:hypothetical protein
MRKDNPDAGIESSRTKRRLLVRDLVDLVQFVLRTCTRGQIRGEKRSTSILRRNVDSLGDVFSKAAGQADSPSPEVLAEQGLATTTVKTLLALEGTIPGQGALTNRR